MARQNQVIAVIIKQYGTGLYHTCVSMNKDDVTLLSTHKDERSADATIGLFWQAYDEGRLKTPEDVAIFVNSIEPPVTAPAAPVLPFAAEQGFLPLAA